MNRFQGILTSLPEDWKTAILPYFSQENALFLSSSIEKEYMNHYIIFPEKKDIFNAFIQTPFDKVKAVIIGQDPYHEPNQAIGIAFAVPQGQKIPPSLKNIFKEYSSDLNYPIPYDTTLLNWCHQGVLLMNSVLTVRAHCAGSHRKLGWEPLVTAFIQAISAKSSPVAFLLFGNDAQKYKSLIDAEKHIIFQAAHPSPLSAHRGFFGSKPFSTVNQCLEKKGCPPINWKIKDSLFEI